MPGLERFVKQWDNLDIGCIFRFLQENVRFMTVWSPTELQFIQGESLAPTTQKAPREKTLPLESFLLNSPLSISLNTMESTVHYKESRPLTNHIKEKLWFSACLLIPIPAPQLVLSPFTLSPKAPSHLIRLFPKVRVQSSCYFTCLCSQQHCSLSSPSVKCSPTWFLVLPLSQTLPSVF